MSADYVILAVVAFLSIGSGLFLLHEAKNFRNRNKADHKHMPLAN